MANQTPAAVQLLPDLLLPDIYVELGVPGLVRLYLINQKELLLTGF
jgi:hypothetical protein